MKKEKNIKDNSISIVLIVLLAFIVLSGIFGFGGMMGGYSMMGGYGWSFGWIFMTLILIALVLFIIWLIKQIQK